MALETTLESRAWKQIGSRKKVARMHQNRKTFSRVSMEKNNLHNWKRRALSFRIDVKTRFAETITLTFKKTILEQFMNSITNLYHYFYTEISFLNRYLKWSIWFLEHVLVVEFSSLFLVVFIIGFSLFNSQFHF